MGVLDGSELTNTGNESEWRTYYKASCPQAPKQVSSSIGSCYGEFDQLVSDEGKQVGIVHAGSLEAYKDACNRETFCNSFSFNPAWGCLLKDRVLDGSELTNTGKESEWRTYYKASCPQAPRPVSLSTGSCYGEFDQLVSDEGKQVGTVHAGSLEVCKDACNREPLCNSFSFNPVWGCLLKDRVLDGSELTKEGPKSQWRTYFKAACTPPAPAALSSRS